MQNSFDYVIVGAGSAGCVLADRLSASGRHSVLLIEEGDSDKHLLVDMPKGIGRLMGDPRFNHFYPTEPESGNGGVGETWIRGKTLGGSSSINGMVYNRGQPDAYDHLEELGCTGWNWKSILPYFKAMEDHPLGASDWRGAGGALHLSLPPANDRLNQAALKAAQGLGLKHLNDINGAHGDGAVGLMPHTIHAGRRCSASRAFLAPALDRKNLTVVTGTRVDKVSFDGRRATGVACIDGTTYRANKEVILSAGALESPAILMRSGLGDPDKLHQHGIASLLPLPGVGMHLIEHRVLFVQCRVKSYEYSQNNRYNGWRLAANTAQYLLAKSGLMARGSFEVGAFIKATPESQRPDAQILLTPYSIDTSKHPLQMEDSPCITLFGFVLHPESQGSLELRSASCRDAPVIHANYLATRRDQQIAIGIARTIRKWLAQPPLKDIFVEETVPGTHMDSDEQLLDAWRKHAGCGYHTIGTCRMGIDEHAVVDPHLRVRGTTSLRVMDASVLPFMVAGNTNAPVMAMAARGADLILADAESALISPESAHRTGDIPIQKEQIHG